MHRKQSSRQLLVLTPPIQQEITNSLILKNLVNYHHFFLPIVSHHPLVRYRPGNPTPIHLVLLTRDARPCYTFAHYFTNYRYYLDLIDSYKGLLHALVQLHGAGLIYAGFGILQHEAIRIDAVTKRPLLHDFQYTWGWGWGERGVPPVEDAEETGDDVSHRWGEKATRTALGVALPPYLLQGHPDEHNQESACGWDVYELTQIYLQVGEQIVTDKHKYFARFVQLLQRVVAEGGRRGAESVLGDLDQIIE